MPHTINAFIYFPLYSWARRHGQINNEHSKSRDPALDLGGTEPIRFEGFTPWGIIWHHGSVESRETLGQDGDRELEKGGEEGRTARSESEEN